MGAGKDGGEIPDEPEEAFCSGMFLNLEFVSN
jgi:hypothetical protein